MLRRASMFKGMVRRGLVFVFLLSPSAIYAQATIAGVVKDASGGVLPGVSVDASVNADLRVGALEETITVSGEAPIVDVQNTTQQRVLTKEIIDAIPTGKYHTSLAVLIPGISPAGATA